jgi:hypothetical protein
MEIEVLKQEGFKPFKVVIQTQEEADVLYHLLKMDQGNSICGYMLSNHIKKGFEITRKEMLKKYSSHHKDA